MIKDAPAVVIATDFDGTLAPIEDHPDAVELPSRVKPLIDFLHTIPDITLSIISGRPIDELISLFDNRDLWYFGNHGLQIRGNDIRVDLEPPRQTEIAIEAVRKELSDKLSDIDGVYIENKDPALAVHFRHVPSSQRPRFQKRVYTTVQPHRNRITTIKGDQVLEIRPSITWHKGSAAYWMYHQFSTLFTDPLLVCLGNDYSDEPAFQVANGVGGISITVGTEKRSSAAYKVPTPSTVAWILGVIANVRSGFLANNIAGFNLRN